MENSIIRFFVVNVCEVLRETGAQIIREIEKKNNRNYYYCDTTLKF